VIARILVVDDEVGLAEVLRDTLELEGYDVVVCNDEAAARGRIAADSFDAALLDVFISDEPVGIALAKHIQQVSPNTRVVLMTGYAEESDIKDGYESGVYGCIRKPFVLDDVTTTINKALDDFGLGSKSEI
jgi:two-component system response regulator HydG